MDEFFYYYFNQKKRYRVRTQPFHLHSYGGMINSVPT